MFRESIESSKFKELRGDLILGMRISGQIAHLRAASYSRHQITITDMITD